MHCLPWDWIALQLPWKQVGCSHHLLSLTLRLGVKRLICCRTPTPLLWHFSLHLNAWCSKRWQGIPKTFANCVTVWPSWSDLSLVSWQKYAKWNDPPNIWCWCLSDPQPCSSSFSWSLLPLGLTFLRYGKSAKTFLIFYFSLIVIRPPLIIGHCSPPTLLLGRQAFHVESQSSPTVSDLSHLAKVLALPLEFVASIWQILPKQNAALM